MTKEERSKIASEHVEKMKRKYNEAIKYSIDYSHIYRGDKAKGKTPKSYITVEDCTSEDAVFKYSDMGRTDICLLNFASYKHPGGGFINGSIAQEEAICHASTLYNIISDEQFKKEYEYNQNHLNNNLYENFAIFTPYVVFEDSRNKAHSINVLTVPAPNKNAYKHQSLNKYTSVLFERIDYVLSVMKTEHQRLLILGAFGCGVFGNDPHLVASIFKNFIETKYKGDFEQIVFAIPGAGGDNFNAFEKTFKNWNND